MNSDRKQPTRFDLRIVLDIIVIIASVIVAFYSSQLAVAKDFSDDRSRITAVEVQTSNIDARLTDINNKIDILLKKVNQ